MKASLISPISLVGHIAYRLASIGARGFSRFRAPFRPPAHPAPAEARHRHWRYSSGRDSATGGLTPQRRRCTIGHWRRRNRRHCR